MNAFDKALSARGVKSTISREGVDGKKRSSSLPKHVHGGETRKDFAKVAEANGAKIACSWTTEEGDNRSDKNEVFGPAALTAILQIDGTDELPAPKKRSERAEAQTQAAS